MTVLYRCHNDVAVKETLRFILHIVMIKNNKNVYVHFMKTQKHKETY